MYYTVDEYSKLTKAPPDTIRVMCRSKRLNAIKIGKEWRIKEDDNKSEDKLDEILKLLKEVINK